MPIVNLSVLNQRQTPALYADTFANIPPAGYNGRIFWSTDTFAIYRDNGTGWDLFGRPGTGTVTGTGTTGQIAIWNGATVIGGTNTTGSGSVVLSNSPALTSPSFTSVNVTGGIAAMPTGSGTLLYSSALGSYVPYTGATTDLNLGANNLNATNIISSGSITINSNGLISSDTNGTINLNLSNSKTGDLRYFGGSSSQVFTVTNAGAVTSTGRILGSSVLANTGMGIGSSLLPNTLTTNELTISGGASLFSVSATTYFNNNLYYNSGWKYRSSAQADQILMDGTITFNTAISGSTDATATLLTRLKIFNSGAVVVNQTTNDGIGDFQVTGISNLNGRVNVNGATDNSLFALNVSGTVNGSSPSFTGHTYTVTGNLTQQFYHVFTGAVGQTLTVPTPSGNNSQYLIVNNSANILTVAAYSGTNIITLIGTSVASITLAANARVLLIADGNNKYYQAF